MEDQILPGKIYTPTTGFGACDPATGKFNYFEQHQLLLILDFCPYDEMYKIFCMAKLKIVYLNETQSVYLRAVS